MFLRTFLAEVAYKRREERRQTEQRQVEKRDEKSAGVAAAKDDVAGIRVPGYPLVGRGWRPASK